MGALACAGAAIASGRARDGEEQINANYSHNGCSRVYKRPG